GDAVNLASRVEGLNKVYGTSILITDATYIHAQTEFLARPIDYVAVKGKRVPVQILELLGQRTDCTPAQKVLVQLNAQALASYRQQDWAGAIKLFQQVLHLVPD